MVPGSRGLGSVVLAAITTLAPSAAARWPIASPMPREPPVMKRVLPLRVMGVSLMSCAGHDRGVPSHLAEIRLALFHERSERLARSRLAQHAGEAGALFLHALENGALQAPLHQPL